MLPVICLGHMDDISLKKCQFKEMNRRKWGMVAPVSQGLWICSRFSMDLIKEQKILLQIGGRDASGGPCGLSALAYDLLVGLMETLRYRIQKGSWRFQVGERRGGLIGRTWARKRRSGWASRIQVQEGRGRGGKGLIAFFWIWGRRMAWSWVGAGSGLVPGDKRTTWRPRTPGKASGLRSLWPRAAYVAKVPPCSAQ